MMQQMDDTWNPHIKLEFFKVCVRTTMSALGQKTSSIEKQELINLETTLSNLFNYKEQLVLKSLMRRRKSFNTIFAGFEIH